MRLDLFKAQRLTSRSEPTPDLSLHFTVEMPESPDLKTAAKLHTEQGQALADALFAHLPGGVLDALLCHMMQKRASLFVVRIDA